VWRIWTIVLAAILVLGLLAVGIGAAIGHMGGDRVGLSRGGGYGGYGNGAGFGRGYWQPVPANGYGQQSGKMCTCTGNGPSVVTFTVAPTGGATEPPPPVPATTEATPTAAAPTEAPTPSVIATFQVNPVATGPVVVVNFPAEPTPGPTGGIVVVGYPNGQPMTCTCTMTDGSPGKTGSDARPGSVKQPGMGGVTSGMMSGMMSRGTMIGLVLMGIGLLATFVVAVAALVIGIVALRRSRRTVTPSVAAVPVYEPEPVDVAEPEPVDVEPVDVEPEPVDVAETSDR